NKPALAARFSVVRFVLALERKVLEVDPEGVGASDAGRLEQGRGRVVADRLLEPPARLEQLPRRTHLLREATPIASRQNGQGHAHRGEQRIVEGDLGVES